MVAQNFFAGQSAGEVGTGQLATLDALLLVKSQLLHDRFLWQRGASGKA
jgi:hypothetical protein